MRAHAQVRPGLTPRGQEEGGVVVQLGIGQSDGPGLMLKSKIEICSAYDAG